MEVFVILGLIFGILGFIFGVVSFVKISQLLKTLDEHKKFRRNLTS